MKTLMIRALGVSIMCPEDPERIKEWIQFILERGGVPTFEYL
jgi:hypothetical protein